MPLSTCERSRRVEFPRSGWENSYTAEAYAPGEGLRGLRSLLARAARAAYAIGVGRAELRSGS